MYFFLEEGEKCKGYNNMHIKGEKGLPKDNKKGQSIIKMRKCKRYI
jgi:hypothetical protein